MFVLTLVKYFILIHLESAAIRFVLDLMVIIEQEQLSWSKLLHGGFFLLYITMADALINYT